MQADLLLDDAVTRIEGPLLYARREARVGLNAAVEVVGHDGRARLGRVAALDESSMVIEVLEPSSGLAMSGTRLRLRPEPLLFGVGPDMLGRVYDSLGRPIDGGPPVAARARMRIEGAAINPAWRELPRDFIETGVTAIDLMNSLVRGQKLPLFSAGGLPHDRLATEIASRARLRDRSSSDFAIVFVGMGVSHDAADRFRGAMESSGALGHTALFLNLADEPGPLAVLPNPDAVACLWLGWRLDLRRSRDTLAAIAGPDGGVLVPPEIPRPCATAPPCRN